MNKLYLTLAAIVASLYLTANIHAALPYPKTFFCPSAKTIITEQQRALSNEFDFKTQNIKFHVFNSASAPVKLVEVTIGTNNKGTMLKCDYDNGLIATAHIASQQCLLAQPRAARSSKPVGKFNKRTYACFNVNFCPLVCNVVNNQQVKNSSDNASNINSNSSNQNKTTVVSADQIINQLRDFISN